jgi:hypothetical protein
MTTSRRTAARYTAIAVLAGMILAQSAPGQELPRTVLLANAVRQFGVRFELTYGRVSLKVMRSIQTSIPLTSGPRRERFAIRAVGGDSSMDYELTTAEQQVSIRFSGANQLEIRRTPVGDSKLVPVEFHQPAAGPVSLKIGQQGPREFRAPSLWHLLLAEPAQCRQSLVPLLNLLQPKWELEKTRDEVRAVLLRMAGSGSLPDQTRWAQWVEQLGDNRFAKREAADRQLREAGRAAVAHLQQLDSSRLDAEQQYRVRRIIQAVTAGSGDDASEQIASWLFGDASVWLAMLSGDEEPARKTAARQLGTLLGKPIQFDPAADAPTRKKQIEALRAGIFGK